MTTPTQEFRRLQFQVPPKIPQGLDARVHAAVGAYRRRRRIGRSLRAQAEAIDALAKDWCDLTDQHLRERLRQFRDQFRRGGRGPAEWLPPALAAIREAADRQLGLRPYVVQLMGALALHGGYLAEMATGEGKTLTAGLVAVLAGWTRRPCHIVTVNDYLAERDADWLGPLYQFCGVAVGHVIGPMEPAERAEGYAQDVTYTTSKEIVADFLRDRLHLGRIQDPLRRQVRYLLQPRLRGQEGVVMRGLHTAIVDEADSVLVDEAVTPLIISRPMANRILREACEVAQQIAARLAPGVDYRVDLRYREVEVEEPGRRALERDCSSLPGLWQGPARRLELVKQALTARELFHEGQQYIIRDGKVVIVDEFTGRAMPQRTWREGLHQAIEAKEGLVVTDPSETLARLSFQRFFRLFSRLSGMTGTAREAAGEFWQIYRLPLVVIPVHRPCCRRHLPDRVFAGAAAKWDAIVEEVVAAHARGQPILVGTRSISASETLAARLAERGLECQVLNAVRHREEAQIVAEAGQAGRITIATNMAGRGTDIKLGSGVVELGGLHVIATERHESGRIDRQLFGRAGRQGDPGSAQAFVSAEDELLRRFLPAGARRTLHRAVHDGLPGAHLVAAAAVRRAQHTAQRQAFKQRRSVLMMDSWLDEALSFTGRDLGG